MEPLPIFDMLALLTCDSEIDDHPRSMRDPEVRKRRKAMLHCPHIEPLAKYAAELRKRKVGEIPIEVPDFDPLDGGIKARVLFLLEKPGPMAGGSGFISRNNDDPTAANILKFMQQAEIPRKLTIIWNVIPWWNGTITLTAPERREGLTCMKELVTWLLPDLCAVVMVGGQAAKAQSELENMGRGLGLFTSCHPARKVEIRFPEKWAKIPSVWAEAIRCVGISG